MTTPLHEQRLAAVLSAIRGSGARSVVDLGCGDGDLLLRLAATRGIERIVGLDLCRDSLGRLGARLRSLGVTGALVELVHGSITDAGRALRGYDLAALVETIEHIDPGHLSRLEHAVFAQMRPGRVLVTTPNAEFNGLLGVPRSRFRHPGHRFEWDRAQFRRWSAGVARRNGYQVVFSDLGGMHPQLGGASQMAEFRAGAA